MARFYHGSVPRYLIEGAGYYARQHWKKIKSKISRKGQPAETSGRLREFRRLIALRDWVNLREIALELARYAEEQNDSNMLGEMAAALVRLGEFGRGADLYLAKKRLCEGVHPKEWLGDDITDKHLLVSLLGKTSLGTIIRHGLAVSSASQLAARTTLVTEPRMVPLFDRTFHAVEVITPDALLSDAVYHKTATFQHLAARFFRDPEAMERAYLPLVPDRALVDALRAKYRVRGDGPLIGIAWGSKSHSKDVPSFEDWRRLLGAMPATYVSLQYGSISPALRRLRRKMPNPLVYDETVDQLEDMDRFAAQVAAMDAVVTISNTGAHLTGALGIPAVFIIDDLFHTNWPVTGDRVPWYPKGRIVRKDGRAWSDALDEIPEKLKSMLPEHDF